MFQALDQSLTQLATLITHINRINLQTVLPDGSTLTNAITRREMLALRQSVLTSVIEAASIKSERYRRTEIRYEATVPVAQLHQEYDDLARQRRELDTHIQSTNWITEYSEE